MDLTVECIYDYDRVFFARRSHFITGALVCDSFLPTPLPRGTITSPSKPLHSIKLKRVFRRWLRRSRDNAIPFFSRTHK